MIFGSGRARGDSYSGVAGSVVWPSVVGSKGEPIQEALEPDHEQLSFWRIDELVNQIFWLPVWQARPGERPVD
jgi:hypothetical protein